MNNEEPTTEAEPKKIIGIGESIKRMEGALGDALSVALSALHETPAGERTGAKWTRLSAAVGKIHELTRLGWQKLVEPAAEPIQPGKSTPPEGVSCMTAPDMVIAQRTKDGPLGWGRGKQTPSAKIKCWAKYMAKGQVWIVMMDRCGKQQLSAVVHGSADSMKNLCVRLVRWGIGISRHNSHWRIPPLTPEEELAAKVEEVK